MTSKKYFTGDEIMRIIDEANRDTTLQNTLDINDILTSTNHKVDDRFETMFRNLIDELNIPENIAFTIAEKLSEYRYIEELHELTIGKYIRWIRKQTGDVYPTIASGGIVNDILFEDAAIKIRVFQLHNRYTIKLKYDNFLLFQKTS